MWHRALPVSCTGSVLLLLAACAGGNGQQPDPNVPNGQTTSTGGVSQGPGPDPATAGGSLANLDPSQAKQETWQLDKGPTPFLHWEGQHLRISAGCRQPTGQMDCDALRFVRRGPSVELTPQEKARMAPPGATVCVKIRNQLTTGRDPKGNEDGFCIFPDGSMIATGSLEYHALK
jgi:putative hemolysin